MKKFNYATFLVAAAGAALSTSAMAAAAPSQVTTSMSVSVVVKAECKVRSPELDMGSGSLLGVSAAGTARIAVECTNAVPYQIGLDAGDVAGSTVAARMMSGANPSHKLSYNIYTDAQRSAVWGNTPGVDTVAGVGTGVENIVQASVYLPQQKIAADAYTSNVTVTLSF